MIECTGMQNSISIQWVAAESLQGLTWSRLPYTFDTSSCCEQIVYTYFLSTMQTNSRKLILNLKPKARFLEPAHRHLYRPIDIFRPRKTFAASSLNKSDLFSRNLFSLHQQYKKIHGSPAWMQFRDERSPYERAERLFTFRNFSH